MRLYRTAAGRWAGTQAAAGKGFAQVEVPTDKPGLIAWLNDQPLEATERLAAPPIAPASTIAPAVPPQLANYADRELRCPKCTLTEKAAKLHADGMAASAIADRILEADGFVLGILAGAVAGRFQQLQNGVARS